jgi:hypothetical protein
VGTVLLEQRLRTGGLSALLAVIFMVVGGAIVTVASTANSAHTPLIAKVVEYGVPLLLLFFLYASLSVVVRVVSDHDGRGLEIAYGFGLIRQRFRAEEILAAQSLHLSFMEMGGWGYRGSLRFLKYAALATRRGEALELTLTGHRRFIVTVDNPDDFAVALRAPQ